MMWFSHSGDLGDIIYALPAIRAAGGGMLYLFNDRRGQCTTMTAERADSIRPLLLLQDYIKDVIFVEADEGNDHPLNNFRNNMRGHTIADGHLLALGINNLLERNRAWLKVDYPCNDFDVIFNRTSRYRNANFPWKRVYEEYNGRRTCFVGLKSEYDDFCCEVGRVTYRPTNNLLGVARLIAGCRLFVGNQSCCYAIAEGLKSKAILEVCAEYPNCCFPRMGVIQCRNDSLELPDIDTL